MSPKTHPTELRVLDALKVATLRRSRIRRLAEGDTRRTTDVAGSVLDRHHRSEHVSPS